jgi:hypothetical protein
VKAFAIYIRYISLLLCGGLIFALYINVVNPSANSLPKKTAKVNSQAPFSFFNDVMAPFIPALKS